MMMVMVIVGDDNHNDDAGDSGDDDYDDHDDDDGEDAVDDDDDAEDGDGDDDGDDDDDDDHDHDDDDGEDVDDDDDDEEEEAFVERLLRWSQQVGPTCNFGNNDGTECHCVYLCSWILAAGLTMAASKRLQGRSYCYHKTLPQPTIVRPTLLLLKIDCSVDVPLFWSFNFFFILYLGGW
jgi:hypothetical protein